MTDPVPTTPVPAANGGGSPGGSGGSTSKEQPKPASSVANICVGQLDGRNEKVDYVFFKRTDYAIYQCNSKIIVCYSDNPDGATKQIAQIAELIAQRDKLQYLTRGSKRLALNYREPIAEALRLGLEGKTDIAKQTLAAAIDDVNQTLARTSRVIYLSFAAPVAAACAMICFVLAFWTHWGSDSLIRHLYIATGAGAVGGLLSIAIAIRDRTVASDAHRSSNCVDATVRLMMAVISATALFLLLSSGVLHDVSVGGVKLSGGAITGPVAFLIGFAAGFLERLLPDLLQKRSPASSNAANTNKDASGGTSPATVATGGGSPTLNGGVKPAPAESTGATCGPSHKSVISDEKVQ